MRVRSWFFSTVMEALDLLYFPPLPQGLPTRHPLARSPTQTPKRILLWHGAGLPCIELIGQIPRVVQDIELGQLQSLQNMPRRIVRTGKKADKIR